MTGRVGGAALAAGLDQVTMCTIGKAPVAYRAINQRARSGDCGVCDEGRSFTRVKGCAIGHDDRCWYNLRCICYRSMVWHRQHDWRVSHRQKGNLHER